MDLRHWKPHILFPYSSVINYSHIKSIKCVLDYLSSSEYPLEAIATQTPHQSPSKISCAHVSGSDVSGTDISGQQTAVVYFPPVHSD